MRYNGIHLQMKQSKFGYCLAVNVHLPLRPSLEAVFHLFNLLSSVISLLIHDVGSAGYEVAG